MVHNVEFSCSHISFVWLHGLNSLQWWLLTCPDLTNVVWFKNNIDRHEYLKQLQAHPALYLFSHYWGPESASLGTPENPREPQSYNEWKSQSKPKTEQAIQVWKCIAMQCHAIKTLQECETALWNLILSMVRVKLQSAPLTTAALFVLADVVHQLSQAQLQDSNQSTPENSNTSKG